MTVEQALSQAPADDFGTTWATAWHQGWTWTATRRPWEGGITYVASRETSRTMDSIWQDIRMGVSPPPVLNWQPCLDRGEKDPWD